MNYDELLEYLDIENAAEFKYFETFADLLESDEEISEEAFHKLLNEADKGILKGIIEDYFEDLLEGLPDNSGEIYSLMYQIKKALIGMVSNVNDDEEQSKFNNELYRFMNWLSIESEVELIPENKRPSLHVNVRDAITAARIEKLGGEKYEYYFEEALNYELDSYFMSFADLIDNTEE